MTHVNRILTTGDFSTLSSLVEDWRSAGHALAPIARKILVDACVVFASDLPPDVASLGCKLEYSDGGNTRTRGELTALDRRDDGYLPVHLPLGLALLGRRAGDVIEILPGDRGAPRIRLEKVLDQPQRQSVGQWYSAKWRTGARKTGA